MQTAVHKGAGHEIEALRTLGDKGQKTALYSFGTKDSVKLSWRDCWIVAGWML